MLSNIKRNRTLVKVCINYVESEVIKNYENGISKSLFIDVVFKKDNIKLNGIPLSGKLPRKMMKVSAVEDSKGKIYIGIDTSKLKLERVENTWCGTTNETICDRIISELEPDKLVMNNPNSIRIRDRLIKDGDSDIVDLAAMYNGFSLSDLDKKRVEKTKLYQEISNEVVNILNDRKAWFEISLDKYFKDLPNRKFIPIVILDIDKGVCDFTTATMPKSDRSRRETIDISKFINTGKLNDPRRYMGRIKIPESLVTLCMEE